MLRLVSVMSLILILFHLFSILGRQHFLCDFGEEKCKNIYIYIDIYIYIYIIRYKKKL